jgi:hypothetical protein
MDFNHANRKHMPRCGVAGVVMPWHRRDGHTVRSGKRSTSAALNLLPRVIAGI